MTSSLRPRGARVERPPGRADRRAPRTSPGAGVRSARGPRRFRRRAATPGAGELRDADAGLDHAERLEVRLVAAVGSNAVHSDGLRIESAHRGLAADRALSGHGIPQGGRGLDPAAERSIVIGSETPRRCARIAHGSCVFPLPQEQVARMSDASQDQQAPASVPGSARIVESPSGSFAVPTAVGPPRGPA